MGQKRPANQPNNKIMTLKLKYMKLTPLFHEINLYVPANCEKKPYKIT